VPFQLTSGRRTAPALRFHPLTSGHGVESANHRSACVEREHNDTERPAISIGHPYAFAVVKRGRSIAKTCRLVDVVTTRDAQAVPG